MFLEKHPFKGLHLKISIHCFLVKKKLSVRISAPKFSYAPKFAPATTRGPRGHGTAGPFQQGQYCRHQYILLPSPGHGTGGGGRAGGLATLPVPVYPTIDISHPELCVLLTFAVKFSSALQAWLRRT